MSEQNFDLLRQRKEDFFLIWTYKRFFIEIYFTALLRITILKIKVIGQLFHIQKICKNAKN